MAGARTATAVPSFLSCRLGANARFDRTAFLLPWRRGGSPSIGRPLRALRIRKRVFTGWAGAWDSHEIAMRCRLRRIENARKCVDARVMCGRTGYRRRVRILDHEIGGRMH